MQDLIPTFCALMVCVEVESLNLRKQKFNWMLAAVCTLHNLCVVFKVTGPKGREQFFIMRSYKETNNNRF